jgi:hypothetical protein
MLNLKYVIDIINLGLIAEKYELLVIKPSKENGLLTDNANHFIFNTNLIFSHPHSRGGQGLSLPKT